MTSNTLAGAVALALVLPSFSPAFAQETPATPVVPAVVPTVVDTPVAATPIAVANATRTLPANTVILLSLNEELSTK